MSYREIKERVFDTIAPGGVVEPMGREIYRVGTRAVHARYCASGNRFNINPNTLRADFELWICGSAEHYYLIPTDVVRGMYEHPSAYRDNHHSEIRVVSINRDSHHVNYAAPGVSLDLSRYLRATLAAR